MDPVLFRFVAAVPIVTGALIIVVTIVKCQELIRLNRAETYENQRKNDRQDKAALALLFVFLAGFGVGLVDIIVRGVEIMYFFITIIFFLGALFVFFAVRSQAALSRRLREKTLETMKAFVSAIDMKDSYTKGHSEHVYSLVNLLYKTIAPNAKEGINLPKLLDAAMLHDIGKISIKDEILNKTGKLEEREWELIRTHPQKGREMLADTCYRDIGSWVLYHHERMDGNGYYGIAGEDIPLESKMITIADTYSALCTDRVYRAKRTHKEAVEIMQAASGAQLDPALVQAFLEIDKSALEEILPQNGLGQGDHKTIFSHLQGGR